MIGSAAMPKNQPRRHEPDDKSPPSFIVKIWNMKC